MAARKQHRNAPLADHMVKANLVEEIVKFMHKDPSVLVESKVKLPSLSNPMRKREIDVLVTGRILGRSMHVAFECKNYGQRVGIDKIDEFKGKLEDVGIPVQHGICISSKIGFTVDAQNRAQSLGIRLMVLDGLTLDRLAAEVHEAFQSVIYLLLSITSIVITNEAPEGDMLEMIFLRDETGNYCGSILDLIWAKWRDGQISTELGEHEVALDIPSGWNWIIRGKNMPSTASATVRVSGHIVTFKGRAERLVLRDAVTGRIERGRITTLFDDDRTSFPITSVRTEEELTAGIEAPAVSRVTIGRLPLPRILFQFYWPPSERVLLELNRRANELAIQGRLAPGVLANVSTEELEGTDMSVLWEPVWAVHPAAGDPQWPWKKTTSDRHNPPKVPRRGRRRKR